MIYRRSHIKTDRKVRNMKKAGSTHKWHLRFQRESSAGGLGVPPEKCGDYTPSQAPQLGRGAHITSVCEKQQVFVL